MHDSYACFVHLQSTSRVEPASARAETNWSMMPQGIFMKLWSDHWHLNTAAPAVSQHTLLCTACAMQIEFVQNVALVWVPPS